MGYNNILPRGGFLRGILAGLILIFFVFVGLSAYFPLPVEVGPTPAPVTELDGAPLQPALDVEDSSEGISVPMETPAPSQLAEVPATINDTAPEVAIAPAVAAPVNSVSALEPMSTPNDIQIGSDESAVPVVVMPTAPEITTDIVVDEPTVEIETQLPQVTTELEDTSLESDITIETEPSQPEAASVEDAVSVVEPAATLELSGQTLINQTEPDAEDEPAPTVQVGAFEAFSTDFADEGDLPLLSIILLASTVTEAQTVASIPAPLTLAVASDNPDAAEIIASYRALGGEVVLLLPTEGSDIPARLDAILADSDGVIGVLDDPEGSINQDARSLGGIMAKLTETGHAIVTVDGLGLNRATVMAKESSVPATGISHIIDTSHGTIAVVREFDKVVLQLGDQRSVSVYASATADMLFGLNFWLESQKAQVVTVAPLSASIRRN